MDEQDVSHLRIMVREREAAELVNDPISYYYQGRIDEYCAQNAIDQTDIPSGIDLKLPSD